MKKLLFVVAALASCMTVSAKYWFGGSVSYENYSKYDQDKSDYTLKFSPTFGMAIEDQLDLGVNFSIVDEKTNGQEEFSFFFEPFLRYTFFKEGNFSMFVDGGFQYGIVSPSGYNYWELSFFAEPGVKYALSDHFALQTKFWGLWYTHQSRPDSPRPQNYKNNTGIGFDFTDMTFGLIYEF